MHRKRRVEIVVEKAFAPLVLDMLTRAGAKGYSILPVLAGSGLHGRFMADDLTRIGDSVLIFTIVMPETAIAIEREAKRSLEDVRAIVTFVDVEVIRDDHF